MLSIKSFVVPTLARASPARRVCYFLTTNVSREHDSSKLTTKADVSYRYFPLGVKPLAANKTELFLDRRSQYGDLVFNGNTIRGTPEKNNSAQMSEVNAFASCAVVRVLVGQGYATMQELAVRMPNL